MEKELLRQYPKKRNPLPAQYQAIYDEHYNSNRNGGTTASFFSQRMERWMHRKVAADVMNRSAPDLETLEIGAGTLNQLRFERAQTLYDIVEPYEKLYRFSADLKRVRDIYADISAVPDTKKYDRITSVATFEHICDLPDVVSRCCALLKPGGCLRVAIPNEGRFLWKAAYTLTTGLEFRLKYHLDYSRLMKYEHVNTADEIEEVLRCYFEDVALSLMGLGKDFSFYRYYECRNPRRPGDKIA